MVGKAVEITQYQVGRSLRLNTVVSCDVCNFFVLSGLARISPKIYKTNCEECNDRLRAYTNRHGEELEQISNLGVPTFRG